VIFLNTVLIVDSNCDLPLSYIKKSNIVPLFIKVLFKGIETEDDFGQTLTYKEFYNSVKNGEIPSTSQINSFTFIEEFKRLIKEGKSIIYIGISSALSGCTNSATIAKNEILIDNPLADISIIDSKSASLGCGLLCYYAMEMLNAGNSKDTVVKWVEENKLKLNHWFTVDDLHHLKRGGRVSSTAAIVGTLLDIKPVLHVDNEGRLIPVFKVKGRKKSIKALMEKFEERAVDIENQVISISHGDCLEDAEFLKKLILEKYIVKDVIINEIGPAIGSHSGPGTVALFFFGAAR
jgi:DegV family protein with EDD domain